MSLVSIVEYKSFKALIEGAQQLTKPPNVMCRHTAKNKICDEYNEFKKKIKVKLNTVEFVCSTADFGLPLKEVIWGLQPIGLKVRHLRGKVLPLLVEDSKGLTHMIKLQK
ncbi:unnamed protein product [Diatraea saccharalis]|uniref:Uncharacterized protein n=1 Tax=Diatraea saccharalis TaxID=40085 RepID=A0A9N9REX4_9NEOP|nr:unnamed protein product [Diatraea saccharalis]